MIFKKLFAKDGKNCLQKKVYKNWLNFGSKAEK